MGRSTQYAFNSGEISPRARARHDLLTYASSAALLNNVLPSHEGPTIRAPGTRFIAETRNNGTGRLIPFKKSQRDFTIIVATNLRFQYIDAVTLAVQQDGASAFETTTPYPASTLSSLYGWQSADVMYFTHKTGTYEPHALRRFAGNAWDMISYPSLFGPFLPQNTTGNTLSSSNVAGAATITATGAPRFVATDIGKRFRVWDSRNSFPYDKWGPEKDVTALRLYEHDGRVYEAKNSAKTSAQPPIHEEGTQPDRDINETPIVNWQYKHEGAGSFVISGFTNTNVVTVLIEEPLPETVMANTQYWAEGCFSNEHGWPRVGIIHQERLVYGSTLLQPDTIYMSRTNGFNENESDFKQSAGSGEIVDDNAIQRTVANGELNPFAWMMEYTHLLVGHEGGIFRVTGPSPAEPITPAGAAALPITGAPGCNYECNAVRALEAIIYPSVSGKKLYALRPDDTTPELTALARHIGKGVFKELCWAGENGNRLFALDNNGRVFVLLFDLAQQTLAWSRLEFGGDLDGDPPFVESIAAGPGADGVENLWLIIRRRINGSIKRYVERMEPMFEPETMPAENQWFVDAGVRQSAWVESAAVTYTIGGFGAGGLRGDSATVTASSGNAPASWLNEVVAFRKSSAPARASDIPGEARIRVTAINGSVASGVVEQDADAFAGVALSQYAVTTDAVTGLDHLEGEDVLVQADGADYGPFTVSSGTVTLPEKFSCAIAGLSKPWEALGLNLRLEALRGPGHGRTTRIDRVSLEVANMGESQINVQTVENGVARKSDALAPRVASDLMSNAPGLRNGLFEIAPRSSRAENVQVRLSGAGALYAEIHTVTVEWPS